MSKYYRFVHSYEQAEALKSELMARGIDEEEVNILLRVGSNENPVDLSSESLGDREASVETAPRGTVSVFGITFAVLTGMAGGTLLAGIGPIAALAGSAVVAAGGIGMMLTGIGVPEEKHDEAEAQFAHGAVLVAVETNNPQAAALMKAA